MTSLVRTKNQQLIQPSQKRSHRFGQCDIDEFLSSDLEISFASTVSLNSPSKNNAPLTPDREYAEPMDISPLPPTNFQTNVGGRKSSSRSRAYTSSARLFGNDLSNNAPNLPIPSQATHRNYTTSNTSTQGTKRTQRSALPTEWLMRTGASETKLKVNVE